MSSKSQVMFLKKEMEKEIYELNNMSANQAKKRAKDALVQIGIINDAGKVKKPYTGGFINV